jgi:hypothetical protein
MAIISSIAAWFLKKRYHQIELFIEYPLDVQNEILTELLFRAQDTEWGLKYDYATIKSYNEYRKIVPISTYEEIAPYVDRLKQGEHNLLWPTETRWFAQSSGTTTSKSKFIPVTEDSLIDCHYKGGKDMVALYLHKNPDSDFISGKTIAVAGSSKVSEDSEYYVGDLSAILMSNLPLWAQFTQSPDLSITLMSDWSKKVDLMVQNTINEDIRAISGVPSWMLVILQRALEITGKTKIRDLWPNFELVIHGGVSFAPYVQRFKEIMDDRVNYQEVYNASEGFFAIQDSSSRDDLLLMLDYGIFYEFLPISELGKPNAMALGLDEVEIGKNYALIISTNAGLWRYMIGDTIVFTDLDPFRIRISGRTKSFINSVGEELIVENAEFAISQACQKTASIITEYTAAPLFNEDGKTIVHQWFIEFEKEPLDLDFFAEILDNALKSKNSDYEAKRFHDMVLGKPKIFSLPKGVFREWLSDKGKLGGQHKIPRLSNDRLFVDEILLTLKTKFNDR